MQRPDVSSSITMVHSNPARVEGGCFFVDRKFHLGMTEYAAKIRARLTTVHPEANAGAQTMDLIQVPLADLSYEVMVLQVDSKGRPRASESDRFERQIAASTLVYGGGLGCEALARKRGVPYIMILEYDLQTQLVVTTSSTRNPLRRASRAARCLWRYAQSRGDIRRAHSLHCNGYPIFDAVERLNSRRLLYFDSRMSPDVMISEADLQLRLAQLGTRPLRLIYSGRYERLKGADDAVRVAVECLNRGLDIEMHCYGQGSLREEMRSIATSSGRSDRIHIHDAVPYPELAALSRGFDLFVCCHIQNDPSCTYVEAFGAGLPIAGYGNKMWERLSAESRAGVTGPIGDVPGLVRQISNITRDGRRLHQMSTNARQFALEHRFEREFALRIDALNAATGGLA